MRREPEAPPGGCSPPEVTLSSTALGLPHRGGAGRGGTGHRPRAAARRGQGRLMNARYAQSNLSPGCWGWTKRAWVGERDKPQAEGTHPHGDPGAWGAGEWAQPAWPSSCPPGNITAWECPAHPLCAAQPSTGVALGAQWKPPCRAGPEPPGPLWQPWLLGEGRSPRHALSPSERRGTRPACLRGRAQTRCPLHSRCPSRDAAQAPHRPRGSSAGLRLRDGHTPPVLWNAGLASVPSHLTPAGFHTWHTWLPARRQDTWALPSPAAPGQPPG